MNVRVNYIIAFAIGCIAVIGFRFITKQFNNSSNGQSGVYPLLYEKIADEKNALSGMAALEGRYASYRKNVLAAQDDISTLKPPMLESTDAPILLQEAKKVADQIRSAWDKTRIQDTYNSRPDTALSAIAADIGNSFYWTYNLLWDSSLTQSYNMADDRPVNGFYLNNLKGLLDSAGFVAKRRELAGYLGAQADRLTLLIDQAASTRETINQNIASLQASIKEVDQSSKDRMLMYIVIPLFGLIVILLLVLPSIYRQNPEILRRLFEQKVILQIFTVFILVMTILLLGIGDKIKAETLGTLLGGISVYILQRTNDNTITAASDESPGR